MAAALDFFGDLTPGEAAHRVMVEERKREGKKSLLGKRKRKMKSGKYTLILSTLLHVHVVYSTCKCIMYSGS